MSRNSKLPRWPSSSLSRGGIRSSSMTRDFLSRLIASHLIYPPAAATRIPHYELSARHRVPRAPPPLKSLILAGINEFPEESRGITLPRVASGPRRRCRRRRWRLHAILQVGIESTPKRKGADSILSRKMPRDGAGEMGLLTRRMKLLKRQRHVYLTMKAVTSVARSAREKINTYASFGLSPYLHSQAAV